MQELTWLAVWSRGYGDLSRFTWVARVTSRMKAPWQQGEWHNSSTASLCHPTPGRCCPGNLCWVERWQSNARRKKMNAVVGWCWEDAVLPLQFHCAHVRVLPPICLVTLVRLLLALFSLATKLRFPNLRHLCADRIFFFQIKQANFIINCNNSTKT